MTKQSLDERLETRVREWFGEPVTSVEDEIKAILKDVLTEVLPTIEQVDEEMSKLSTPDKVFYGGQKSIIHRANTNLNNLLGEKQ